MRRVVLVAYDRPEEACEHGEEVLDSTESLGSYLVIEQLHQLQGPLSRYTTNETVAAFLVRLGEALHDRTPLYQAWAGHGATDGHRR